MTQDFRVHEKDSWTLKINVTDEATGLPKDLSGATVDAVAQSGLAPVVQLVATPGIGTVTVEVPADTFTAGIVTIQVRVTIGPDTQTLSAVGRVLPSLMVAA